MASRRRERKAAGETSQPLDVDIDPDAVRAAQKVAIAGFHMMIWPYVLSLVGGSAVSECDSCGRDHKDFGLLAIPIVGPFLPFGTGAQMSDTAKGVLIADGALQSLGAALFLGSLAFSPKLQKKAPGPRAAGLTLQFAPVASPSAAGFGVTGSF